MCFTQKTQEAIEELWEHLNPLADCVCVCVSVYPSDRRVPAQPAIVPNYSELMQTPPSSNSSITLETGSIMHPGNQEAGTSQVILVP